MAPVFSLLHMSMPSALPSDSITPLSRHALSPRFPADLDVSLSGSEDEGLAYPDRSGSLKDSTRTSQKIPYKRPPGVKTLAQWGGLRFPDKTRFGNLSFKYVLATERSYCVRVGNRVVKQPYLLSFQHYMRAMENARRVATKRAELLERTTVDLTSEDVEADRDDCEASSGWSSKSSTSM